VKEGEEVIDSHDVLGRFDGVWVIKDLERMRDSVGEA
jgi:hypothetical protein